jgi:hypothetical protein
MSDELDPLLLRAFALSERPLADAEFVARMTAQLRPRGSVAGIARALPAAVAVMLRALAIGITAPLRLKHAGLLALAAVAVAICTVLQSSL